MGRHEKKNVNEQICSCFSWLRPTCTSTSSPVRLRLIQINDVYQLDKFPSFASLVNHFSNEHEAKVTGCDREGEEVDIGLSTPPPPPPLADRTIVCLSGDFLAPSLLSSLDHGHGMVDVMGEAGVTHVCLGNHEDDVPTKALARRIEESSFVWLNSNMRSLDRILGVETSPYEVIEVASRDGSHTRSVALLGLLTEDPSIYRDGAFGGAIDDIEPVIAAADRVVSSLRTREEEEEIDLFVPLTHQDRPLDRELARRFGRGTFPVVVGGHDHDVSDETVNGSRILKTGMNAAHAAVIDFVWESEASARPVVSAEMVAVDSFAPDANVRRRVDDHNRVLEELESAKLFSTKTVTENLFYEDPEADFSTANNRFRKTEACTAFAEFLRRGLGAECAILNAGGIRGNKVYKDEWFTFADLKSEFPFDDPVVTVSIPGKVLEDAITFSRRLSRENPPEEDSGLLHTCDMIWYCDDERKIKAIGDHKFERNKHYQTACSVALLNGLDNNDPLVSWKKEIGLNLHEESGRPIKFCFVEFFAICFWMNLGSFDWQKDTDEDGFLTREKIKERFQNQFGSESLSDIVVDDIMSVADADKNGRIDLQELLAARLTAHVMHGGSHRTGTALRHTIVLNRMASDILNEDVGSSIVRQTVQGVKQIMKTDEGWHFTRRRSISSVQLL